MELIQVAIADDSIDFVVIRHGTPGIDKLDFLVISGSAPDNHVHEAVLHRDGEVVNLVGSKKMLVMDDRAVKYFGPILLTLDELNTTKGGAYKLALERIKQHHNPASK